MRPSHIPERGILGPKVSLAPVVIVIIIIIIIIIVVVVVLVVVAINQINFAQNIPMSTITVRLVYVLTQCIVLIVPDHIVPEVVMAILKCVSQTFLCVWKYHIFTKYIFQTVLSYSCMYYNHHITTHLLSKTENSVPGTATLVATLGLGPPQTTEVKTVISARSARLDTLVYCKYFLSAYKWGTIMPPGGAVSKSDKHWAVKKSKRNLIM